MSTPTRPRACDSCRIRKVRCDRVEGLNAACTPCAQNQIDCTVLQKSTSRTPPKWYIAGLEAKVEMLEALLTKLHPGVKFPELEHCIGVGCWTREDSRPWIASGTNSPETLLDATAQEEDSMQELVLSSYLGIAHPYTVVQSAMRERFKKNLGHGGDRELFQIIFERRRSYFWLPLPWEVKLHDVWKAVKFEYPPHQLATQLIDSYFVHTNVIFPLLHRPTFMQDYERRLHERDAGFGSVLLMVCAIGSRWMENEPRNLIRDDRPQDNFHSAGWPYFQQVQRLPKLYSHSHGLEAMQCYALSAIYLLGSSSLLVASSVVGFAMRISQEMGFHRRGSLAGRDSSPRLRELWKRVFWNLVVLDRLLSSGLGRACSLYNEEIDLGRPLEIDDEDWPTDPTAAFPQTSSSRSSMTYLNSVIDLMTIRVECLRRMNMESYEHRRKGETWNTSVFGETERQLEAVLEGFPAHLRLLPSEPASSTPFIRQSLFLHVVYYTGFIGCRRSSLYLPSSLISSVRAGQACIQLVATANSVDADSAGYWISTSVFASAVLVQLGVWSELPELDDKPSLRSVFMMAINFLSEMERRWVRAGKYKDLLQGLLSIDRSRSPMDTSVDQRSSFPPPLIFASNSHQECVSPFPDWHLWDNLVQAPSFNINGVISPAASASVPGNQTPFDIWNPPANAEEWQAWQCYLNPQV